MIRTGVARVGLRLLGGFAATVGDVPVPETAWRLRKARELVKLLALARGHRLHREQAMDVLWRDREPEAAANNLHQAVHVARRALGAEAIETRGELLQLVADVDVDRLEEAARDARRTRSAAGYRAALALYGGELLPENRYDDWALERRDELAALAAALEEELGELGNVGLETPLLPVETSSFVGRERELSELKVLLRGTRQLTLAGTGGTGKTRLALRLARAAESGYTDGAALVELAAVTDPGLVPDAFAAALDVRALSGQTLVEALVDFLTGRSLLLVVDNCEHLLRAASELAATLLRSAPGLTILATSREPLRVPGEVVFRVPSLEIPDPERRLGPDVLARFESVRLFVERAVAAAPAYRLDDANAADVARICFRLDGLPLALELAAGRIGALSTAAIAERLDDRFGLLRASGQATPTRQHTLTATLQWSHDLLEPDEQTLFRRLSGFSGGFSLPAVERVCGFGELDPTPVADLLARLVEKSLVTLDALSSGDRRYRLLETVRVYARDRLEAAGEAAELAARHAAWALELAEEEAGSPRLDRDTANLQTAIDTLLVRAPDEALRLCVALVPFWLRRIDLHEAKLRFERALAAVAEPTALRAEALLGAAAIDFRSGDLRRGAAHAEESYDVASRVGDARARWRALQYLGEVGISTDSTDVALPWFEQALELARRESLVAEEAVGVYSIGIAHWIVGELERAEELMDRSIELFRTLAGLSERITSPLNFAELRTTAPSDPSQLHVAFEDTLQPFIEISRDAAIGYVLANRAGLVRARHEFARAGALLDESAARFATLRDDAGLAAVLMRRAYLELSQGALPAARAAFEEALALRQEQGDRRGLGLALAGLGLVDTMTGEYASADRYLAEAREIFRRAGDRWGLASTLWKAAELGFARGSADDAEAALEEARAVIAPTQRERWIANTLAGLAEVARLRGDPARARDLLADARRRYEARRDPVGIADVDRRLRALSTR